MTFKRCKELMAEKDRIEQELEALANPIPIGRLAVQIDGETNSLIIEDENSTIEVGFDDVGKLIEILQEFIDS